MSPGFLACTEALSSLLVLGGLTAGRVEASTRLSGLTCVPLGVSGGLAGAPQEVVWHIWTERLVVLDTVSEPVWAVAVQAGVGPLAPPSAVRPVVRGLGGLLVDTAVTVLLDVSPLLVLAAS